MLNALRTVFAKEARDLLRDRRTLFFLFAMPLLMPLLYLVGGSFVAWYALRQTRQGLPLVVVNGERLPELVAVLERNRMLRLVEAPPDVEQALRDGELTVVLEFPPAAAESLAAGQPITLTLTSGYGGWRTDLAVASIEALVSQYGDDVLAERLAQRDLNPVWLEPIHLQRVSLTPLGIAAAPTVGGQAVSSVLNLLFLPFVVASWVFSGGLDLMADMTIGEKERRTLESLLATPTSRVGVLLGKIALSIVASAIVAGLWSLDSLAYVYLLSALPAGSGMIAQGVAGLGGLGLAAVWLVLLMVPLMVTANGVMAAVCGFARSRREVGYVLTIFQLLLPGLAFLAVLVVGAAPPPGVYALPVMGVLVAVRDLWSGGIAPGELALAWGAAAAYAALTVLLAAYVFSREWALMRGM
jgi:sodium transport system permease protein